MRMLIVGAGIGGLTAALALRQAGFDAHVYEQASVLREVGAGVAISPNAVKVLHRLGLAEALRAVGVVSRSLDSRDWQTGALLGRVPLAEAAVARWGAPFYHLHRADLHDALRAALGDQHLTLGARCVAVEQRDGAATARFADGREATGELLVGADGIHSVVREHVAGPDRPIWSRQISWRGLAPAAVGHDVRAGGAPPLLLGAARGIRVLLRRGGAAGELGRPHAERRRLAGGVVVGARRPRRAAGPLRGVACRGAGADRGHRAGVQVGPVRPAAAGDGGRGGA